MRICLAPAALRKLYPSDVSDDERTLKVAKLPEAKRGFVLLPKRWIMERDFACLLLHKVTLLISSP